MPYIWTNKKKEEQHRINQNKLSACKKIYKKKKKKDHGLHKEKRENGSPKDVYVNIFIFCLKKKWIII
jgi:hypothetical protein